MDLFGLGALAQAVVNLGTGIYNTKQQQKYNEEMIKLNKEQFQYQKDLQKEIFNREDNAVQRRMADLSKAGLNPILASGQSANAGATVANTQLTAGTTGAPQMSGHENMMNNIMTALQGSQNIAQSQAQEKLINKQILTEAQKPGNISASTQKVKRETEAIQNQALKMDAERQKIMSEIALTETENTMRKYDYWMSRQTKLRTSEKMPGNAWETGHYAGRSFNIPNF